MQQLLDEHPEGQEVVLGEDDGGVDGWHANHCVLDYRLAEPEHFLRPDHVELLGVVEHHDAGVMFTLPELATVAQLRLPLPVVVADNGGYGEIRREMVDRSAPVHAVDLPIVDFAKVAKAMTATASPATTRRSSPSRCAWTRESPTPDVRLR